MKRAGRVTDKVVLGIVDRRHALAHGLTVLHDGADFEPIAEVRPALEHEWIVPRGSI